MTIKQIEPLLQRNFRNVIWVFTPKGENVLDIIYLDSQDGYQPTIDRNQLKLELLKNLPHKVVELISCVDIFKGDAYMQTNVRLGKGVGWNV